MDVEVYYHHEHGERAAHDRQHEAGAGHYTQHWPYRHRQVRILSSRATSASRRPFRAPCPTARASASSPTWSAESDIDMVFYVVAHEMGHQWWRTRRCGADITLLGESMSQYSALMVMEQEYGPCPHAEVPDSRTIHMRARGSETSANCPLLRVRTRAIHYNKGSVVLMPCASSSARTPERPSWIAGGIPSPTRARPIPPPWTCTCRGPCRPTASTTCWRTSPAHITLYDNQRFATAVPTPERGYDVTVKLSTAKFHADSN